ncbi:uncharacterized protein LOC116001296 [Ipomoea triloba]|uniref:uncharacterized protein LOC116001296 n=1 Tax=Ipomoea triloba TaxID=35885 RepID=UPI00125E7724|nr:uncharacterized protein LOC116001296 [Ipomoea triloba]
MREALSWLKDTGMESVDVETDLQLLFNALSCISTTSFYSVFGLIVDDVKELASLIDDAKFGFVKRSTNQVAHFVARAVGSESGCGKRRSSYRGEDRDWRRSRLEKIADFGGYRSWRRSRLEPGLNMDSASGGCDEGYSRDIGVEGSACDMEISPGMTNREGFKQSLSSTSSTTQSTVVKRRRLTNRVGCKAKVVFKVNRNLDAGHQLFVASCVRANIGPTRSYRLFKEIVGEYSNVGATAFGFEYDVDDGDQLSRVFLADAVSRKNFSLFGDVVSFDATYRTNRYNLVFVPFTGIDNHKRCITFGVGLLMKEDIDSYVWLLESFKKIMGHDPICAVTDQDPVVKVAVAQVFGASKHRFCMWHIMYKVGEKVGPVLSKDEVFRRKLNGIVWDNSLDSNAFELRWNHIMEEYGLGDNVLKTPLALERHAMVVYTISIFYDIQEEICSACFSCQVVSLTDIDGCVSYVIKDDRGLESIPSRYLVHRWTKGACLHPIFHIDGTLVDQSAKVENVRALTNLMWSDIYACVGLADGNIDRLSQLQRVINEQRQIFLQDGSENGNGAAVGNKQSLINSFCGDVSMGSTVDVHDSVQAKNKGSGKRLKSARERAASKCAKQSRRCHTCDEYGHNSRTCPSNT